MSVRDPRHPVPRRQRGVSLVEMMVGLVVALLVAAAAVASTQVIMGRQRSALDVGTADGNESNALAAMKYELAQAGLGFFADGRLLCPSLNLSQGSTTFVAAAPLMPLGVTATAGGVTVDVLYGSALESVSPARLAAAVSSADTSLGVGSYLPVAAGQSVLLVPARDSVQPTCTVRTATAVTPGGDAGAALTVGIDATGGANQVAFTPVNYTTADSVSQLGQLQWSRFRLENGQLWMERHLAGSSAVMARNVVAFAAEYGVGDGGTSIASWQPPSGDYATLDAAHLGQVRALRVGVVVRSSQAEKKVDGHCVASTALPALFGKPVASTDPDWACYRYRAGSIVVPLRNLALGLSP